MSRQVSALAPRALLCALALLMVPTLVGAQNGDDRLTIETFLEFESVRPALLAGGMGPEISPDGSQVLYGRMYIDKINDRYTTDLWLVNADGTRNRFLTKGGGAAWSPDGTRIAYVSRADDGSAEIFVRWMDAESATSQITHLDRGPGGLAWSPDGEWIAFTMMVPAPDVWDVGLPARPEGARWNEEPKVVTRMNYRRDYAGYTDGGYSHVFVVPATGGTPRQLTDGDWNHGGAAWSADGREIYFTSLRIPEAEYEFRESEIYAVDVESGAIRTLTSRHGPDLGPVPSPDGRFVAYVGYDWTDDTYITSKLYVIDTDGSNPREISGTLDRSPQYLHWAADGGGVYFSATDHGTENLYFAAVAGGEPRKLTEGEHYLTPYSMSRNDRVAGVLSSPTEPGDVVVFDVRRPQDMGTVTAVNEDILKRVQLAEVEEIWYPSSDGLEIQAWIMKPPGFDPSRQYPLALSIHGGPHGEWGFGTPYMWYEWQYHAAQGYVVLYVNPRGSSGYGSAFGNEIKNAYPGMDYDDLMAGVDTVINRGYVDTDNLFVYGCSGGGVLTAWVVGHTDRFAAASSECPVTNWLSFVGTTDGVGWYRNFANLPWEDPSEHLRRSPLMYVGNVTTPTILITGEGDLRTPMPQTEEYYQALKFLKVPTAMIRLKDEWHAYFNRPSNTMRMWRYRLTWFDRYKR